MVDRGLDPLKEEKQARSGPCHAPLVRAHTNLKLEHRLELYETGQLPWDIEMVVEESLSDDEDGPPPSVSESESESESDKDSD